MTAWRILKCVLKLVTGYSRAPVHALDRDGCAIVVGRQRQLGGVRRTHTLDDGEEHQQQQGDGLLGPNGGSHFDRGDASFLKFPPGGHNRHVGTSERRR